MRKISLYIYVPLAFLLSTSLTGCDWLGEKLPSSWNQSNTSGKVKKNKESSLEKTFASPKKEKAALVPWKGDGIAANTFIEISKRADLGVVNIGTTKVMNQRSPYGGQGSSPFEQFFGDDLFKHFFGGPQGGQRGTRPKKEYKQQSLGSGFIISEDGLIVTNNHVIDKADEITVTIGQEREYIAKVIGTDPKTDVALIKIEPEEKLNPLVLGDSSALEVGEIVVAIGNPFGLSHTVTQGIVSAKERTIGFGPYDNFIQTDASINPGNSGGPLLNLKAEVVGINTAIHATGQGIGFAIPVNLAKNILPQLEKDGVVTRGWLGVMIQPVDKKIAKSLGLDRAQGALVAKVIEDSPAADAGIEPGDVILKVAGKDVKDSSALPKIVANFPVGKEIEVVVMRNKKRQTLVVEISKLQDEVASSAPSDKKEQKVDKLGLKVSPLADKDRKKIGLDKDVEGVVIRSIEQGSPAASRGLKPGDYIIELNQQKVPDIDAYNRILKKMKDDETVMLKVIQEGGARLFVIFSL